MKTVQEILNVLRGGSLERLEANYIRLTLDTPAMMPLVIEAVGPGPRGLPQISVAHYYQQNGDAMRDPEIVFEIDAAGEYHPISYLQDSLGLYQEAIFQNDAGQVLVRPKLAKDLQKFSRQWSKNLLSQGYLVAAKVLAAKEISQGNSQA